MSKLQLLHVKIFWVKDYEKTMGMTSFPSGEPVSMERDVNDFILHVYNKYGNYCEVDTNSKFVTIRYNKITEVNRD